MTQNFYFSKKIEQMKYERPVNCKSNQPFENLQLAYIEGSSCLISSADRQIIPFEFTPEN